MTAAADDLPLLPVSSSSANSPPRTPPSPPPHHTPHRPVAVTACYCFIMVINGGLVGAFGPSLEPFARQTGSSAGALGSAVMQNRLAKLAGTVLWGYYAAHVQQQKRTANALPIQPHTLISLSLLLLAASCAVFGHTKSAGMLQLMMIVSGFMYGVSDSAANLLITWVWQHDARKQRINVATLNAAFTIGAFVTPIVCAASMHHLRGHVWPAYYILALCAILEACILPYLPTPPAPRAPPTPRSSSRLKTFAAEEEDDEPSGGAGDAGAPDASPLQTPPASTAAAATAAAAETPPSKLVKSGELAAPASQQPPQPPSSSSQGGWVYVGDPECEEVLPRYLVVMAAICTLCFFANGCEHAVATWLSSFGIQQRHLGEETMAIMTSNFWTAMSMGRIAWALLSGFITSAWPCLFANTLCCIVSALAMAVPSQTLLWSSAVGIGLGVASSFPAAVTLPSEMGIVMTPRMMTTLQLSASGGEMLCPFLMGLAFQLRAYRLFYYLMLGWETFVLCLLGLPWGLLTRRIPVHTSLLRALRASGGFAA